MDSPWLFFKSALAITFVVINLLLLAVGFNYIRPDDRGNQPLREVHSDRVTVIMPHVDNVENVESLPRENLQEGIEQSITDTEDDEKVAAEKLETQQLNNDLEALPTVSDVSSDEIVTSSADDLQQGAELAAKELAAVEKINELQKKSGADAKIEAVKGTANVVQEREDDEVAKIPDSGYSNSCVRIGPFNEQWFTRMHEDLDANQIDYVTERKLEQVVPLYRVFMGPFLTSQDLTGAQKRISDVATTVDYYVFRDADNELPYISFGVFSSKARARDYSEKLTSMGLDVSARQEGEKVVAGHWVVLPRTEYQTVIAPKLKKVRYRELESDCFSVKR